VVPLPARDVDVAFDAPDGDWSAALCTKPTVDLYLWDIRPNLAEREYGGGLQAHLVRSGGCMCRIRRQRDACRREPCAARRQPTAGK